MSTCPEIAERGLSGKFGKVLVNSVEVASVGDWKFDSAADVHELPIYGNRKEFVGGQVGATGSITGARYLNDAGQILLRAAVNTGEAVCLELYRRAATSEHSTYVMTDTSESYIYGYAIITSFGDGAPRDSHVPFSCNFTAIGSWVDSEDAGS